MRTATIPNKATRSETAWAWLYQCRKQMSSETLKWNGISIFDQ